MKKDNNKTVSLIPLGGVQEVGKNLLVIEYEDDIMVVDAGVKFPDEALWGIDLVIPDTTYLIENKEKIKGIVLTHGHEDHIGALPFILKNFNVPVYGTKLTLGLVKRKLVEHGMDRQVKLVQVKARDVIKLGCFEVELFRVNHSIPDGVGLGITTPAGLIVHSGDFKIDQTPIDEEVIDFAKLGEYGQRGVMLFICDSTNVERLQYTPSEKSVGETFNRIFRETQQRIIVASFASNIHRLQQIIDAAVTYGRKVAVVGRSMINVVEVAVDLGYLKVPKGTLVDLDEINRLKPEQACIMTTGSQGEPMAALTRMAADDHRQISISPGDTVVISAAPIPGNDKLVARTIDNLFRRGAEVIYKELELVHVSGHAGQEEIKLMLNILKPTHVMPFHGEYRHLARFTQLAGNLGISEEHVIKANIGDRIECNKQWIKATGQVSSGSVFIDGLGIGDVGNIVLRDRKCLAEEGVVIMVVTIDKNTAKVLAGPDIISRGFVFVRESEDLMNRAKDHLNTVFKEMEKQKITEWSVLKQRSKDKLSEFFYQEMKRRPMILPIIMEV
ncbi:MAG: ribonuclease J [Bacillota bacterium]|nr:ribonuclease J [Bacillota bacterium]